MSTTNRHLPRALPTAEQQRQLPPASTETEPCVGAGVGLQQPPKGLRVQGGTPCSRASGGTGLVNRFYDLSLCISSYLERH